MAIASFNLATTPPTNASRYSPMARPPAVRIGSASPSNPRQRSVGRATSLQPRTYGLTQRPSWRYSSSWRAPRSGYPENVHSFRQRSVLRWLLQERPALCMGRFVVTLLEEDAEWLIWI